MITTLLRLRGFRLLLGTRLFSQAADGAFQAALASYVVFSPERQATPAAIASAFAVMLLPFTLFGPIAGAVLDRWRRRQVLVLGNGLRLLLCLGTAALVLARVPTPLFFAAALMVTGIKRFVLAGLSAGTPHVVPETSLVTANALAPTAGTVATTAGAALAVVVRLALPAGPHANAGLLALAALGYACSAVIARRLRADALGPAHPQHLALRRTFADSTADLRSGLRHLRHEARPARDALAAVTVCRFCYGLLLVTLLMLCRNSFAGAGDQSAALRYLGLALGVSAAGFFAAAVVTPWASRRLGVAGWLSCCAALGAVLTPALGLLFAPLPTMVAAFVLGLVSQGVKISVDTTVQATVADDYRGRVFVLYDILFNVSLVTAAVTCALVLPVSGRSVPLVLATSALYATTAVGYFCCAAHHSLSIRSASS